MSKELNIIEASNMEYNEKEFYVKYTNGVIDDLTVTNVNGDLIWNDISKSTSKGKKEFINAKFIPVEKPVSFMEDVKSGKRIRVELIGNLPFTDNCMNCLNEYMSLPDMITKNN